MLPRRTRTYGFVLLVAILLVSYAYYESREYLHGPQLAITTPEDGFSTTNEVLTIEGDATNIATITLNDRAIFVDETGHFKEDVLLMEGYNVFTLAVTDRYERTNVGYLRGTYTPTFSSAPETPPSENTLEESVSEDDDENNTEGASTTTSTTTQELNATL